MTDGQVRYQQVAETQRHNLEMEKLGQQEASAKTLQAEAAKEQADLAKKKLKVENAYWLGEQAAGWTDMLWHRGNDTSKIIVDFLGNAMHSLFK